MFVGPTVYDSQSALNNLRESRLTRIMLRGGGSVSQSETWVDIDTDPTGAWFLAFVAFPRVTSPYVAGAVGDRPPLPTDTVQYKVSDDDIRSILGNGQSEIRTQWWHTSVEFGTVWANGSLNDRSTQYNILENPENWSSTSASSGQRFKRRFGGVADYTDWLTSASGGCSGAVGGWSNYYQQSCVQSWFAGCEGGPAINHRCAGGVQDRASQLLIWIR